MRFAPVICVLLGSFRAARVGAAPVSNNLATEDPNDDPFYIAPSNLGSFSPGQVIRSRQVVTSVTSDNLGPTWQLLYRTTDADNQPEATVTTMLLSETPNPSPAIFSYQVAEDAVQLDCAPSWALINNTESANTDITTQTNGVFLNWALDHGYVVSIPDHLGPKSAFFAGQQEGHAVLDGLRAVINFQKLSKKTPVALYGYSGGAHATVWSENLAPSYAPELNIVGSAHGGTPVDGRRILNFLNGGLFAGFAAAGMFGLANGYEELGSWLYSHLTDAGDQAKAKFEARGYCLSDVAVGSPLQNVFTYVDVADPLDQTPFKDVLARSSLLEGTASEPLGVPKWPRMMLHGLIDQIVPYSDAATYVSQQCALGSNIAFFSLPGEHIASGYEAVPLAISFLGGLLAGQGAPQFACGTPVPELANQDTSLNSQFAKNTLGQSAVNALLADQGQKSPYGTIITGIGS